MSERQGIPKSNLHISRVGREDCVPLLEAYHYLTGRSRGFKVGYNYGLFNMGALIGVCIFTPLPVPEIARGAFGLERNQQAGLFELSRLCLEPTAQAQIHNGAGWFVARCLRDLCRETDVRAVLSYADSEHHTGTVYRALGFVYYGLTAPKKDFYYEDGSKHSRGKVRIGAGEWKPRSQKHRYLRVFDKTLTVLWVARNFKKVG